MICAASEKRHLSNKITNWTDCNRPNYQKNKTPFHENGSERNVSSRKGKPYWFGPKYNNHPNCVASEKRQSCCCNRTKRRSWNYHQQRDRLKPGPNWIASNKTTNWTDYHKKQDQLHRIQIENGPKCDASKKRQTCHKGEDWLEIF